MASALWTVRYKIGIGTFAVEKQNDLAVPIRWSIFFP